MMPMKLAAHHKTIGISDDWRKPNEINGWAGWRRKLAAFYLYTMHTAYRTLFRRFVVCGDFNYVLVYFHVSNRSGGVKMHETIMIKVKAANFSSICDFEPQESAIESSKADVRLQWMQLLLLFYLVWIPSIMLNKNVSIIFLYFFLYLFILLQLKRYNIFLRNKCIFRIFNVDFILFFSLFIIFKFVFSFFSIFFI